MKQVEPKRQTKFSFKGFNRSSKLGRSALNRLKAKRYRGTFVFVYTAEVDGVTVKRELVVKSR